MARKTKDELTKKTIATEETTSRTVKKTSKTSKKVALKNDSKGTKTRSSASAKKSTTKIPKAEKKVSKKEPKSTSKSVKVDSISDSKINTKNPSIKKDKTQKAVAKKTTAKKVVNNKVTTKTAPKKSTTKKSSAKNSTTKTGAKKASTKKSSKEVVSRNIKSKAKILPINPLEYYDLPYRYNQTVVKVLAQNPNTLFVYWDISDRDRENLEKKYGKMFFYNTKPVLVVHNLTTNYTFEIDIDDFANNWYVHVDNTKCKYVVELGRRPKYEGAQDIPINYLNVAFSNVIEIPNDHILFFKENDKIYFKNIKTNKITEKIIKKKPHLNIVKDIYKNYNLSEDENRFDFKNPSSQNPTSTFL